MPKRKPLPLMTKQLKSLQTKVKKLSNDNAKLYTCNQCNKEYKTKCTLRYHLYSHSPGSTFSCNIENCQRIFKNPKRLSDHKRRYHLNTENYVCEYCGYHTRIKCNLTVHRRKHTGEKPYCCEYCGNGFASSYQLNIHRTIHNDQRKYCCIICAESFQDTKTLYHHEALHTKDNKYCCNVCDKSYKQSAGLSQHMRWHKKQQNRCTEMIRIIE